MCVIVHTNRWMCVRLHRREQDVRGTPARRGKTTRQRGPHGGKKMIVRYHIYPLIGYVVRCLIRRFPAARHDAFPTMSCSRARQGAAQKQAPTARTHISDRPTIHPRSSTGTLGISATRAKPRIYNDPNMTHVYAYTQSIPTVVRDGSILQWIDPPPTTVATIYAHITTHRCAIQLLAHGAAPRHP